MAIDITMPALSPTMESGTLAKWLVNVGDTVRAGDIIAEIETDKATMEVEAVDEGTVAAILVEAGTADVKVNTVIARLAEEGEDAAAAASAPAAAPKVAETPVVKDVAPAASTPAPAPKAEVAPAPAKIQTSGGRNVASPLARRIAKEAGLDLSGLKGSGPRGRIIKSDVMAALKAPAAKATAPSKASSPVDAVVPYETVALNNMRKTIARRLTESKQQVPHFYLTVDIVIDPLLKLRGELNQALEARGIKVSVNDMLIKALGLALTQVGDANVSFGGDHVKKFSRADVSVAVAIPGGLITPVVRDAGNKRISEIATEVKDLAARAKAGKLQLQEFTGGTASISNLGMFGIKQFDAVINAPEGLILAVGAGEKRPVVVNDNLTVATVMTVTGSFDHRAIDGAVGAEFLSAFKALVENPVSMLA